MNNIEQLLEQFWSIISDQEYITLCTHVEPDGDTLGSAVALKNLIELNCKKVKEVKISGGDYPRNLLFLDNTISLVDDEFFNKSLKVVVDTSTLSRIYDKRVVPAESIKIDHHNKEEKWIFEIGGDHWPATGQLVALLIKHLNLDVNDKALEGTAVAIITDTESFKERNVSAQTFEMMAYLMSRGLKYAQLLKQMQLSVQENKIIFDACQNIHTQGVVSWIIAHEPVSNDIVRPLVARFVEVSNSEVSLAILKREQGDYRCEIRSKTTFNVSPIATHFGGGGHFNSSGFIIQDIAEVPLVISYINSQK